jgi:membrane protease YdiL (CAAX protease family)
VTLVIILLGDRDFSRFLPLLVEEIQRDAMLRLLITSMIVKRAADFIYNVDRERFHDTDLQVFRARDYLLFLLAGISGATLVMMTILTFQLGDYLPDTYRIPDYMSPFPTILLIATIVFTVPIAGETLMRGVVLDRLRRQIPAVPAVIIVAILSGLLERNLLLGIVVGLISLLTGWLFIKYNSMLPGLILRVLLGIGLCMGATDLARDMPLSLLPVLVVISAVVLAGAIFLLYRREFVPEPYDVDHEALLATGTEEVRDPS